MDWWVTPSGTSIAVLSGAEYYKSGDAGAFVDLNVTSTGGSSRPMIVRIDDPAYINGLLQTNGLIPLDEAGRGTAALAAGIRAVDSTPDFFVSSEPLGLNLDYDQLSARSTPPIGNANVRRYVARRLYLTWEHGTFDDFLSLGTIDEMLTGAGSQAFLRNLQLLEQEGYIELSRTMGKGFESMQARGTAKLIREVERYGAAKGDVATEAEFTGRLVAQVRLSAEKPGILAERRRYELAQTTEEVTSVFRAIMPIVEGIVRRLLRAHDSKKEHHSLGPMISELVQRRIGTRGLWSQLNAVLTSGRDISLHGEELPIAVLRITTETCFELIPQLGSLFPASSA